MSTGYIFDDNKRKVAHTAALQKIKEAVQTFAHTTFTFSHVQSAPQDERERDGLGCALASWAEWNGVVLMQVFAAALEDANFSKEAEQVLEMLKAYQ